MGLETGLIITTALGPHSPWGVVDIRIKAALRFGCSSRRAACDPVHAKAPRALVHARLLKEGLLPGTSPACLHVVHRLRDIFVTARPRAEAESWPTRTNREIAGKEHAMATRSPHVGQVIGGEA